MKASASEDFEATVIKRSQMFFVKKCNFQEMRKCIPFVFLLVKGVLCHWNRNAKCNFFSPLEKEPNDFSLLIC
jgi:hypothetical protein